MSFARDPMWTFRFLLALWAAVQDSCSHTKFQQKCHMGSRAIRHSIFDFPYKTWKSYSLRFLEKFDAGAKKISFKSLLFYATAGSSFENNSYPKLIIPTFHSSPDENKTGFERLSTSRIWLLDVQKVFSKNAKNSFEISMFQFELSFEHPKNLFRRVVFQYKSEVRIKIRAILVGIIDF